MNKKGQVLVLFIVIFPLLVAALALVVDVGLVSNKKEHLENVSRMSIREVSSQNGKEEKIKKLMQINDIDITNLEILVKDDEIRIKNEIDVESIFGKIVGINSYKVKIDIRGFKQNGKLLIE